MENQLAVDKNVKPLHQMVQNQVRVAGKIQGVRKHEHKYYTQIVAPAVDEYSSPSRFELRSTERLGERDDVVNVLAVMSGSARSFQFRDKETGDQKTGWNFSVYLDVIQK